MFILKGHPIGWKLKREKDSMTSWITSLVKVISVSIELYNKVDADSSSNKKYSWNEVKVNEWAETESLWGKRLFDG